MSPRPHFIPENDHFRSWGETQLARLFDRHAIPYLYEHPVAVVDERGHTRIWYPDFQLAGYGVLVEYCGRMSDPNYAAAMSRKEAVYEANGLSALMLTRDDLRGQWPARVVTLIASVLSARLDRLRTGATRSMCGVYA